MAATAVLHGVRRTVLTSVAVLAALGLLAGQAQAHECFNASRSAMANAQIAEHSHGWFDLQLAQFYEFVNSPCDPSQGQCTPAIPGTEALSSVDPNTLVGVILGFAPVAALGNDPDVLSAWQTLVDVSQQMATAAEALGVPSHWLTSAHTTLASGAVNSTQPVLTDGHGIDHFPDVYGEKMFAAFFEVYCGLAGHIPAACA